MITLPLARRIKVLGSRNNLAATRVMEVRENYAADDFEWESLRRLSVSFLKDQNLRLMRDIISTSTNFEGENGPGGHDGVRQLPEPPFQGRNGGPGAPPNV
jgi:hypothetical protein